MTIMMYNGQIILNVCTRNICQMLIIHFTLKVTSSVKPLNVTLVRKWHSLKAVSFPYKGVTYILMDRIHIWLHCDGVIRIKSLYIHMHIRKLLYNTVYMSIIHKFNNVPVCICMYIDIIINPLQLLVIELAQYWYHFTAALW